MATKRASDLDIKQWMGSNPNATDRDIYSKMQEYGVTPNRLSSVMGFNPTEVNQRYSAVANPPALPNRQTSQTSNTANSADSMLGNLFSQYLTNTKDNFAANQSGMGSFADRARPEANFSYQESPYLKQQAEAIRGEANQNLQRNILPSIGSQAIATGGFGGSRQGVVEANALNDVNRASTNAISGLYAQDYQNSMNRQLQQYATDMNAYLTGRGQDQSYALGQGNLNLNAQNSQFNNMLGLGNLGLNYQNTMQNFGLANRNSDQNFALGLGNLGLGKQNSDNSFMLGLGNLGLGAQNANNSFYTAQRGQDLQAAGLGANLYNQGNQGYLGQGQGLYGLGSQQQAAPWNTVNNANAGLGQWSGYGTTTSANTGGGAQGAFGGALAGGQLGNLWGGGSSQLGRMSNSDIEKSWYLG